MIPGDAIRSAHVDGSIVAMCSSATPDMPARQRLIIVCRMIRAGMGRPSHLPWQSPMVDMASPCPNLMKLGWRGTQKQNPLVFLELFGGMFIASTAAAEVAMHAHCVYYSEVSADD